MYTQEVHTYIYNIYNSLYSVDVECQELGEVNDEVQSWIVENWFPNIEYNWLSSSLKHWGLQVQSI